MTCKTFSGMISSFLSGTLEDDSLREFLEHYDKCENCREEVEIQYLVSRAFDHRKEKEVINLSRDFPLPSGLYRLYAGDSHDTSGAYDGFYFSEIET